MRTQEQIDAEIVALQGCKAYAPKTTLFGDDNHKNIDLQIEYLRGDIDTTADEFNEMEESEQSAVMDAEAWKLGMAEESPSSGWDGYKKGPK